MKRFVLVLILLILSGCATFKQTPQIYSIPNPLTFTTTATLTTFVTGYPWCGATGLILTSIIAHRELKLSEAHQVIANCLLPVIGPLIVKRLYAQHPEWDKIKLKPTPYNPSKID